MGRPARKIEARESVESRVINAVKYAFGSPEVSLDRETGSLSISLGFLDGAEVWLDLPFRIRSEHVEILNDEDA